MDVMMTAHSVYNSTLQGKWGEALMIYKSDENIHTTPINSSGDTALHVAVNDDRADMVAQLVDEMKRKGTLLSALETRNDRGDAPLHCAASRGSLKMCVSIAEADQGNHKPIEARNKKGETPLFLAALHGHMEAFLYLYSRCPDKSSGPCKRTSDGETVLHCTIRREHFELAFEIIRLYGDQIVGSVDEKGTTPLHILANKPSSFESSSNFRWYSKLVYNCMIVEPLRSLEQRSKNKWLNSVQKTQTTGLRDLKDLKKKKQKHVWCRRILDQLWKHKDIAYVGGGSALQSYLFRPPTVDDGKKFPQSPAGDVNKLKKSNDDGKEKPKEELRQLLISLCKGSTSGSADGKALTGSCVCLGDGEKKEWDKKESALFIAAKNGVLEILEKILQDKPGAIHETNSQGQNVLHVVVEYRQPHVFKLLEKERLWKNLTGGVDNDGNTVLHLAARLSRCKPWHIPGSALQMQWEMKWFLYIKDITPCYVPFLPNNNQETPVEIFRKDHEDLVKEGAEWLNHTSESCSVVAALIAGVAFTTSTTIPGGTQEETGKPYLERHPAFNMFAFTSLLALCCSITSLTMFLAILTSRQQPRDFRKDLPLKLLLGLSSLFVSIASILVSFSAAFFFVLKDNLKQAVFPLYAATILPLTFYAVAQFPLYADLVRAIFSKVPQSSNRESEKLIL
ncbi:uncharacterized protein LOC129301951 [Prosopis cineraria]|uniref:uncharacterized protein LOC129301951 n=1 Tax=Prosopis cineraria TaxID=364024 RepID=UPI00240EB721|nr:uncharacterized protein LOC129301951 [Prosopis cineraria]